MSAQLMEYFSKHGGQPVIPSLAYKATKKKVEVTEIREDLHNGSHKLETFLLDAETLRDLDESANPIQPKPLLRIACVTLMTDQTPSCLNIQQECYETLLQTFGIEKLQNLAHASVMSFDVLPHERCNYDTGFYCSAFILNYYGLYVTRDEHTGSTVGVLWCAPPAMSRIKAAMKEIMHLANHPGFLLLVTVMAFNSVQDLRLSQLSYDISTVEERTGHRGDFHITHPAAHGSFDVLSANMSGVATAIAANRRLANMLNQMLQRILGPMMSQGFNKRDTSTGTVGHVALYVDFLRMRLNNHLNLIELLDNRAKNQLTALYNLITREEMKLNLHVAQDSKMIASATKRDSTSVKILTAVTVLFLPAAFIAALFSSSMFQWQMLEGRMVSEQFWIYWVTTIPLTIVTGLICSILNHRWEAAARWQDKKAAESITDSLI